MQKIKYVIILLYATIRNKSVVDFFGSTYIIAGNYVRKLR